MPARAAMMSRCDRKPLGAVQVRWTPRPLDDGHERMRSCVGADDAAASIFGARLARSLSDRRECRGCRSVLGARWASGHYDSHSKYLH